MSFYLMTILIQINFNDPLICVSRKHLYSSLFFIFLLSWITILHSGLQNMISLSWLTLLSLTLANLYLILRPYWQPDFNFSVTVVLRLWTWTISYGWDPFVLHGIEVYCLLQNCIAWYWICITMVYFVSHVKHRTTHGFSISGQANQSHNNSHLPQ